MTERKSNSRERNAFRPTIGRERRPSLDKNPTPGPDNYHMKSLRSIGDENGVKVPFNRAIRPISARPGQIRHITMPGPSDYKVVKADIFLKRGSVIP